MVVKRIPQSVQESRDTQAIEGKFISGVERDNLSTLSLDDLANRFEQIEQQGQFLQGKILLEARNRFKSDNEFGAWIDNAGGAICSISRQHRTKLMNLARFFEGRELDKIGISAAYEISAPINADVAEAVYDYARGKNLPVAEVKRQIAMRKGESLPLPAAEKTTPTAEPITEKVEISPSQSVKNLNVSAEKSKQEQIMDILDGLTSGEAKKLLRDCLHLIKW